MADSDGADVSPSAGASIGSSTNASQATLPQGSAAASQDDLKLDDTARTPRPQRTARLYRPPSLLSVAGAGSRRASPAPAFISRLSDHAGASTVSTSHASVGIGSSSSSSSRPLAGVTQSGAFAESSRASSMRDLSTLDVEHREREKQREADLSSAMSEMIMPEEQPDWAAEVEVSAVGTALDAADERDSDGETVSEGDAEDSHSGGAEQASNQATMGALQLLRNVSASAESQQSTLKGQRKNDTKGKGRATEEDLRNAFQEEQQTSAEVQPLEEPIERSYFVFTTAGKPVFVSGKIHLPADLRQPRGKRRRRKGSAASEDEEAKRREEEEEQATTRIGVMTALVSIYADERDRLREINGPDGRITFLQRTPLLFAAVTRSRRREPSFVVRAHLDMLHNQILGLISAGQLTALFKRKAGADVRRLLEGTDPIVEALLDRLQRDRALLLGALRPCRLSVDLRDELGRLLDPSRLPEGRRPPDLLYVLLLYRSEIVTLLRPKKHSAHPVDIQLLINTVQGTSALREAGNESWLPLSLPKFAPQGFMHVYSSVHSFSGDENADGDETAEQKVTLCFVSGNREAFPLFSQWRQDICSQLSGPLGELLRKELPTSGYTAEQVGVTGLRHFVYKSRTNSQVTSPLLDAAYAPGTRDFHRLSALYDLGMQGIHAYGYLAPPPELEGEVTPTMAQPPLKMHYIRTQHEAMLAWVTQPFELYMAVSPWLPKSAVIAAANGVAKWVKKNELSLFLISPPVF